MKRNNKNNLLTFLIVCFSLCSCGGSSNDNSSDISVSSTDTSSNETNNIHSLKSALSYLSTNRNYTFGYVGSQTATHEIIFTENSIGIVSDSNESLTTCFVQNEEGVFSLTYDRGNLVPSEYFDLGNDVWNNVYLHTFYGSSTKYIDSLDDNVNELTVTDKEFKITFLEMVGYKASDILKVDSLVLSYETFNDSPLVAFRMRYNNKDVSYDAYDFGCSENEIVSEYLANGGTALVPDTALTSMRDLLNLNNFTQWVYYFGEDESGYVALETFNDKYYHFKYFGGQTGYGAIEANAKANDQHGDLYGCYYFTSTFDATGNRMLDASLYPTPLYTVPDIVEYYHYPSALSLLKNLQYCGEWDNSLIDEFTPEGEAYMVTNRAVLNDFAYNYSLDSNFEGQTPIALGIDYIDAAHIESVIIYFYYKFSYYGKEYVLPIPMTGFGIAGYSYLDNIYSLLND